MRSIRLTAALPAAMLGATSLIALAPSTADATPAASSAPAASASASASALAAAAAVPASPEAPLTDIPVTGTLSNGGAFDGTLTITELASDGAGGLLSSGTLVGDADGTAVSQPFQAADLGFFAPPSCDILDLDLGPLDLDLLGLLVELSPVHLDITGLTGPGRLVGNLLCAITGLLDPGSGGLLANLLAQLNALLG